MGSPTGCCGACGPKHNSISMYGSPPITVQPPLGPPPGLGCMLLRPDIPTRIPVILASDVSHSIDVTLAQREAELDRASPGPNEQYTAKPPPPVPVGPKRPGYKQLDPDLEVVSFKPPPPLPREVSLQVATTSGRVKSLLTRQQVDANIYLDTKVPDGPRPPPAAIGMASSPPLIVAKAMPKYQPKASNTRPDLFAIAVHPYEPTADEECIR